MENVGTIFNIVLSSANKGEKYEVGVWLDKILPSSKGGAGAFLDLN